MVLVKNNDHKSDRVAKVNDEVSKSVSGDLSIKDSSKIISADIKWRDNTIEE